jgi:ankyrin repeat protein
MFLVKKGLVGVDSIVDENVGSTMLHFACYFGKIKALKTLVEVFKADINASDYRGQSPLHVASVSGELGSLIYVCGLS